MNINRPMTTDNIRILPLTAAELARILKAAQPDVRNGYVAGQTSRDRFHTVSCDSVPTYAMDGNRVTLKRNLTGTRVDIRA